MSAAVLQPNHELDVADITWPGCRKSQASKADKARRGPDQAELNDLAINLLEASQVLLTLCIWLFYDKLLQVDFPQS